MATTWTNSVLTMALAAALAACATKGGPAEDDATTATAPVAIVAAAPVLESWPPADAGNVARPAPTGEVNEIVCPPGGMAALDLLRLVSEKTGVVIVYDEATNQKLKNARLTTFGTWRVQRSRLVDMCRSALFEQNMVLAPLAAGGEATVWSVLDMNNPLLKTQPVFLTENQVLGYADCDGLYVCTTFRTRDTVDTSRIRNALTALTTQSASIGPVQDVPGARAVIVCDFAPVVATMKRLVDEINRNAVAPLPPPVPVAVPAK